MLCRGVRSATERRKTARSGMITVASVIVPSMRDATALMTMPEARQCADVRDTASNDFTSWRYYKFAMMRYARRQRVTQVVAAYCTNAYSSVCNK